MEKSKNNGYRWIGLGFCLMLILILYTVLQIGKGKEERPIPKEEYERVVVTNASEFFTISNCLNKYIGYIQSKDEENIYTLLDQAYINENNIVQDNVLEFVPEILEGYTQSSKKMYRQRINDHVVSYYVYFQIEENLLDGIGQKKNLYAIVYLIEDKAVFSIRPDNGEVFKNE